MPSLLEPICMDILYSGVCPWDFHYKEILQRDLAVKWLAPCWGEIQQSSAL